MASWCALAAELGVGRTLWSERSSVPADTSVVGTVERKVKATLVIVPCGQGKIWDKYPEAGPTAARDAYTGAPFKVNREFAQTFAERWVVLSAKYGFISPESVIPGPYEVTFKRKLTGPIPVSTLAEQVRDQSLGQFELVIGLGGKEYVSAIREAFARCS